MQLPFSKTPRTDEYIWPSMDTSRPPFIVTPEYPLTGEDIDQSSILQRPGVTYTKTTVLIPSDKQLVLIPSTIPVSTNNAITQLSISQADNSKKVANAAASISTAVHIPAGMAKDPQIASAAPSSWMGNAVDAPSARSGPYGTLPSSNSVINGLAPSGINLSGAEHLYNPSAADWMMVPAILEEPFADAQSCSYQTNVGVSVASFPSDGSSHGASGLASNLYSQSPPANTSRSRPQPRRRPSPATRAPKGRSKARKRPLEVPDDAIIEEIEKPKKPRNSFFYFRCQFHHLQSANGERMKAKYVSGAAADKWNELPEEKKAIYRKLAEGDTLRYRQEMKRYKELTRQDAKKAKTEDSSSASSSDASKSQHAVHPAAASSSDSASASSSSSVRTSQSGATPASLSAGTGDSIATSAIDIASFIASAPTIAPSDTVQVSPSLFNEPRIISTDHSTAPFSFAYPAQTVVEPVDYSGQQSLSAFSSATSRAAVPESPLVHAHVSSSPSLSHPPAQMQVYPPNMGIYQPNMASHVSSAYNQMLQQQIQQNQLQLQLQLQQQSGQYLNIPVVSAAHSHSPENIQQSLQDLSFLSTINSTTPLADDVPGSALFAALSQSSTPQLQPQLHPHSMHQHQQLQYRGQYDHQQLAGAMTTSPFPTLSGHHGLDLTNSTSYSVNRNRANTTPNSLAGVLSTIPEFEVIDASHTVSLPTYSMPRHN